LNNIEPIQKLKINDIQSNKSSKNGKLLNLLKHSSVIERKRAPCPRTRSIFRTYN
jgi:hypothetical protein